MEDMIAVDVDAGGIQTKGLTNDSLLRGALAWAIIFPALALIGSYLA